MNISFVSLEKIANKEKGERQQKATILLEKYRKASLKSLRIWWCDKDLEGFCHSSLEEADLTLASQDTDNIKGARPDYNSARRWKNKYGSTRTSIHLHGSMFIVGNSENVNGRNFNLSEKSAPKRKKMIIMEWYIYMDEHIKQNYPKKRTRIEEYFSVHDVVSQFSNDLSDVLSSAMPKVMRKEPEPCENEEDNINDFDQEVVCSASFYSLLRYNIIDTIESSSTNSRNLFKDIWDKMVDEIEAMLLPTAEPTISSNVKDGQVEEVKTYVKTVVANNSYDKLRKALKSGRSNLRTGSNEQWKRRILTIAKAFRDQFQNCKNAFNDDQTEYHYIITFIYQIFKPLFKNFQHIGLTWGEKSLRCSAILFNNSQQDSGRRNPGCKIDAIMKLLEVNLEVSVVEVSGSPKDPDHNHYIGDRNKIAKSLKIILNFIRMNHRGDFQRFRKIKFYGIHNKLYLELGEFLSIPFSGVYYFKRELVFECPTITFLTFRTLPKSMSNLWRMRAMISSSAEAIISYIENADESDYDNELDP
ncbi:371_t:CDS:10, partial [Cetraspora pellucida]